MTTPDYEYRGLMALAWDPLRGDTSGWSDSAFFLEVIAQYGQPVLDVGCGTGRVLVDFAARGIDIDGVDNSPEMLDICRGKAARAGVAIRVHEQSMENLDLPRRYKTILVPSSSLQLVVDPGLVRRTLGRLRAHLLEGGVLVAPIMTLWWAGRPLEDGWERSATRPDDGALIVRRAWSRYDPATECEETRDTYSILVDGQTVAEETHQRSPATRSYTQTQAKQLFQVAGFHDVQVLHGFTPEPAVPEDRLFCVLGRR